MSDTADPAPPPSAPEGVKVTMYFVAVTFMYCWLESLGHTPFKIGLPQVAASIYLVQFTLFMLTYYYTDVNVYYGLESMAWMLDLTARVLLIIFMATRIRFLVATSVGSSKASSARTQTRIAKIIAACCIIAQVSGGVWVTLCDLGRFSSNASLADYSNKFFITSNVTYVAVDLGSILLDTYILVATWQVYFSTLAKRGILSWPNYYRAILSLVISVVLTVTEMFLFNSGLDPNWSFYTTFFATRIMLAEVFHSGLTKCRIVRNSVTANDLTPEASGGSTVGRSSVSRNMDNMGMTRSSSALKSARRLDDHHRAR